MSNADYEAGWQAGHNTGKLIAQQQPQPVVNYNYYYGAAPGQAQPARRPWKRYAALVLLIAALAYVIPRAAQVRTAIGDKLQQLASQGHMTVNNTPVSSLAAPVATKAAGLLARTPEPTDAPQPTEVPTLGTSNTYPAAPTGTPESAQEPPAMPIADAQPSSTPLPTVAPFVPSPVPPAPTAAPQEPLTGPTPTVEPMGQPVAAQPAPAASDAANAEFGGPSYWATEAAKVPSEFRNPSTPQDAPPASNVIR